MSDAYELNGEMFESVGGFLEALAHEYKIGDKNLVMSKLNDHGFDFSDLGVRPEGA